MRCYHLSCIWPDIYAGCGSQAQLHSYYSVFASGGVTARPIASHVRHNATRRAATAPSRAAVTQQPALQAMPRRKLHM